MHLTISVAERKQFVDELKRQMSKNKKIWFLTGDVGYSFVEELKGDRYINCGASEQAMMDIAVGLAYAGQIPFVYPMKSNSRWTSVNKRPQVRVHPSVNRK